MPGIFIVWVSLSSERFHVSVSSCFDTKVELIPWMLFSNLPLWCRLTAEKCYFTVLPISSHNCVFWLVSKYTHLACTLKFELWWQKNLQILTVFLSAFTLSENKKHASVEKIVTASCQLFSLQLDEPFQCYINYQHKQYNMPMNPTYSQPYLKRGTPRWRAIP